MQISCSEHISLFITLPLFLIGRYRNINVAFIEFHFHSNIYNYSEMLLAQFYCSKYCLVLCIPILDFYNDFDNCTAF